MIISQELAQKIVDHLMELVQRNVNIMDNTGIIIASGQRQRINTFHHGGKLAVTEQTVIEISPDDVQNYPGALPGVMWPIDLREKIVGVVGVTGEPHEVRSTAKLIKTVTELILEREIILADYQSENRIKEQFVTLLFSDNPNAMLDEIKSLSKILNYKLKLPRMVILINLEPMVDQKLTANGLQNLFSDRMRESVSNLVKKATFFAAEDMILFYKNQLCILSTMQDGHTAKKLSVFTDRIVHLLSSIQPSCKIQIGLGGLANDESQLRQSYFEAMFALKQPHPNITRSINEHDILIEYLFDRQCAEYSACLALKELKKNFDKIKDKYDMEKTLECLLSNNMNITLTASKMYIHRNTLKFRLTKLQQLLGLAPCHFFQHAMLCKFLLSIK